MRNRSYKWLVTSVLLLLLVYRPISAEEIDGEEATIRLLERAMQSVVKLRPDAASWGSGFYVAPDVILTSAHVVMKPGVKTIAVERSAGAGGGHCTGRMGDRDEGMDLALVRVDCPGTPLPLARDVAVGQQVYVLGSPAEAPFTITAGIVSGLFFIRTVQAIAADVNADNGNSGGPMINASGEAIGVLKAEFAAIPYMKAGIHVREVERFLDRAGIVSVQ